MPRTKKINLDFSLIQLNLLIKAVEHLADAYSSSVTPGDKATVTNLLNMRDRFSEASSKLHG